MNTRIEVEEAENGFTMKVYKQDDDSKDDFGYQAPKVVIAKTLEEVNEEMVKCFTKDGK